MKIEPVAIETDEFGVYADGVRIRDTVNRKPDVFQGAQVAADGLHAATNEQPYGLTGRVAVRGDVLKDPPLPPDNATAIEAAGHRDTAGFGLLPRGRANSIGVAYLLPMRIP